MKTRRWDIIGFLLAVLLIASCWYNFAVEAVKTGYIQPNWAVSFTCLHSSIDITILLFLVLAIKRILRKQKS